jgi:hypothetical protein
LFKDDAEKLFKEGQGYLALLFMEKLINFWNRKSRELQNPRPPILYHQEQRTLIGKFCIVPLKNL